MAPSVRVGACGDANRADPSDPISSGILCCEGWHCLRREGRRHGDVGDHAMSRGDKKDPRDPQTGRYMHQWGVVANRKPGYPGPGEVAQCQDCGIFETSDDERFATLSELRHAHPYLNEVDSDRDLWGADEGDASEPLTVHTVRHGVPGVGAMTTMISASGLFRADVIESAGGFSAGIIYKRDTAAPGGWKLAGSHGWARSNVFDMSQQVALDMAQIEAPAPPERSTGTGDQWDF